MQNNIKFEVTNKQKHGGKIVTYIIFNMIDSLGSKIRH